MDGASPSTIPRNSTQAALRGLEALRHKAFLKKDNDTVQRVDSKIKDLKEIYSSPRPNRQRKPILSPREQSTLVSIVESLLDGQEIDSVTEEALPYLEEALVKRRKVYAAEGRAISEQSLIYMKRIDKVLADLIAIRREYHKRPRPNPGDPARIREYERLIRARQAKIDELEAKLRSTANRYQAGKETSHTNLFGQIEEGLGKIEDAKEEAEMGLAFHPSRTLLAMRAQLELLVQVGELDAAAQTRKNALLREAEERQTFDKELRLALQAKEKQFRDQKRPKIDEINAFWKDKLEKATAKFQADKKLLEREIQWLKKRVTEMQAAIDLDMGSSSRMLTYMDDLTEDEEHVTSEKSASNREKLSEPGEDQTEVGLEEIPPGESTVQDQ
jgi:hypothetical protein